MDLVNSNLRLNTIKGDKRISMVFNGKLFRYYFISSSAYCLILWLMRSPKSFENVTADFLLRCHSAYVATLTKLDRVKIDGFYIQIYCRFQKCNRKIPPPSLLIFFPPGRF